MVSSVKSERSTFTLNTGIMAVGEGNFGRLAQQRTYTTGNARVQLDPSVWETPGAMPEIVPSPDSPANIERPMYDRSMSLQAWGAYGILWPVVHQQLGVSPDLGNGRLSVVPQLPDGQQRIGGSDIRLGKGSADVKAWRDGSTLSTSVDLDRLRTDLTVGAVLPAGKAPGKVTFNGRPVHFDVVQTTRGTEVRAAVHGDGTLEGLVPLGRRHAEGPDPQRVRPFTLSSVVSAAGSRPPRHVLRGDRERGQEVLRRARTSSRRSRPALISGWPSSSDRARRLAARLEEGEPALAGRELCVQRLADLRHVRARPWPAASGMRVGARQLGRERMRLRSCPAARGS